MALPGAIIADSRYLAGNHLEGYQRALILESLLKNNFLSSLRVLANSGGLLYNGFMTHIRHVLGISGGKDSAALAIYLKNRAPSLEIEYYFSDTGKELDETYESKFTVFKSTSH